MSNLKAGFDVDSYNKPGFNFDAAFNEGYGVAIVKLGGNNLSGNQPYRMNGYPDFANKQAKFPIRGAYWVTGGYDPYAAAVFYAQNRAPWTNFDLLDNETLDSGNPWNDAQSCIFFDALASFKLPSYNPWWYGSRNGLVQARRPWPGLAQRRIPLLTAFYNGAPMSNLDTGSYPVDLQKGHQWSSSITIGGSGNIDADAFTAGAFDLKPKGKSSMSTLYYSYVPDPAPDDYKAIGVVPGLIYAIAGDGQGEAAWLETQDTTLANQLAGFHAISQSAVFLSWGSYLMWKGRYRAGAPAASVQVDSDKIAAAIAQTLAEAVPAAVKGLKFTSAYQGTIQEG